MKLVLASKSPRRIELLSSLGFNPVIMPADADETLDSAVTPPQEAVKLLACRKAQWVAERTEDAMIIAADTLVYNGGVLLGKPCGEDGAAAMLSELSGKKHSVFTGFCVIYGGKTVCRAVETKVKFRKLDDSDISEYIATKEPFDKAGAYGIQGIGSLLVDSIEGDYFNVVGLPISELFAAIKEEFGFSRAELINAVKGN